MAMNKLGISANLMSLGGLAIAIGLMVDGSVVVVENAYARLGRAAELGETKVRAILNAVAEVATPVIFGVGIIILVFLPLMTLTRHGRENVCAFGLHHRYCFGGFVGAVYDFVTCPVFLFIRTT
jgi:heavy metal efflux system protein